MEARARAGSERAADSQGPDASPGDLLARSEEDVDLARYQRRDAGSQRTRAPRWCLPASPGRPLSCALVVDVAAALRRRGPVSIVAPFAAPPLTPSAPGVVWIVVHEPDGCAAALDALPADTAVLLALPEVDLVARLTALEPGSLDGLILPVDAGASGLRHALALLRGLARRLPELGRELPIGALAIGAGADEGAEICARLQRAAARQHRVELESFGVIPRDPEASRSLLLGVPIVDLDAPTAASRSLDRLGDRLARVER